MEKVHAVVARSTFGSENAKIVPGPLLEIETWKKCRPLWREAHLEVTMYKEAPLRLAKIIFCLIGYLVF